jgi:hypothetical protein
MNSSKKNQILILMSMCFISTLACRPVLAISWNEFLIVSVLFIMLLGPPLYRFIRRVEQIFKHEKNDNNK